MKKRRGQFRILTVLLLLAVMSVPQVQAQLRSGGAYLKIIPGARQQSLGSSLTGVITAPSALFANPAAAGFLREWQLQGSFSKWLPDIYNSSLLLSTRILPSRLRAFNLALGINHLGVGEFNSSNRAAAPVSAGETVFTLALAKAVRLGSSELSFGSNLKYYRSVLAGYSAGAGVVDAGLLLRSRRFALPFFDTLTGWRYAVLSAGFSMTNMGGPLQYFQENTPLPRTFRAGVAVNLGSHTGSQFHFTLDYRRVRDERDVMSFGGELTLKNRIVLRSGYNFDQDLLGGFTFGFGVQLDDPGGRAGRNRRIGLDFASLQQNIFFSSPYRGSAQFQPIGPERFYFIEPLFDAFLTNPQVTFRWTASQDPDLYDDVSYRLLVSDSEASLRAVLDSLAQQNFFPENFDSHPDLVINTRCDSTVFHTGELQGGDYFWSVIAIDRDGHFRLIRRGDRVISRFELAKPELQITGIRFQPHKWITQDSLQGELTVVFRNSGQLRARNIALKINEMPADHLTTKMPATVPRKRTLYSTLITELHPLQTDSLTFQWQSDYHGLMRITGEIDAAQTVVEEDEDNNRLEREFYTIPKGFMLTDSSVTALQQPIIPYQLPFIAEVFFAVNSSEVGPEYTKSWILGPILDTLATRLQANPELHITLTGFADPNSDTRGRDLARERALAVRAALLALGVQPEQIRDIRARVLPRRPTPANPDDARWVFQERRKVEIGSSEGEARLFLPVSFTNYAPKRYLPVVFTSSIRGSLPVTQAILRLSHTFLSDSVRLGSEVSGMRISGLTGWKHHNSNPSHPGQWLDKTVEYSVQVIDALGREFRTFPSQVTLRSDTTVQERRFIWPLKFGRIEPVYSFYWEKLFEQIDTILKDKEMRIRFAGHACAIGPIAINQRLSRARATVFRDTLLQAIATNFPQDFERIRTQFDEAAGFGESRPFSLVTSDGAKETPGDNETPLGRVLNRRIEIIFYKKGTSLKATE